VDVDVFPVKGLRRATSSPRAEYPRGSELVQGGININRIPENDTVQNDAARGELVFHALVALVQLAFLAVEDLGGRRVPAFLQVARGLDVAPVGPVPIAVPSSKPASDMGTLTAPDTVAATASPVWYAPGDITAAGGNGGTPPCGRPGQCCTLVPAGLAVRVRAPAAGWHAAGGLAGAEGGGRTAGPKPATWTAFAADSA
jgi:hypothetical protein